MIDRIIGFLAPAECRICGRTGAELCVGCGRSLQLAPQICFVCETKSDMGAVCIGCGEQSALAGVSVAVNYEGDARDLILNLKFKRARSAAGPLGNLLAGRLPDREFDAVTAVPVAPARRRERGYNQAELIARRAAKRLGLPYLPTLGRTTAQHQIGLGRVGRQQQVRGAFYPTRPLRGVRLLLIDDVITTGATLNECARTLKSAGAGSIWGAAVARHLSNGD